MQPNPKRHPRRKSVAAGGKAPAVRVIADRTREDLANDVMAEFEQADARQTFHVSQAEKEQVARQERQFLAAMIAGITDQLAAHRIYCTHALPDGEGRGYRFFCREKHAQRQYEADLGFEESVPGSERTELEWFRTLLGRVCERILSARDTYYRRAGLQ